MGTLFRLVYRCREETIFLLLLVLIRRFLVGSGISDVEILDGDCGWKFGDDRGVREE